MADPESSPVEVEKSGEEPELTTTGRIVESESETLAN